MEHNICVIWHFYKAASARTRKHDRKENIQYIYGGHR